MNYGGSILVQPGEAAPMPALPAVEDRATAAADPGYTSGGHQAQLAAAWHALGYGEQYREERVDPETALTYSAVWGCVRVISQALASIGWHVYERQEDGRTKLPIEDNEAWLLDLQSNPETSALAWREVMLLKALTWGNAYAEIERNGYGKPQWLWQLDPGRVEPARTTRGNLVYEVSNGSGVKNTVLQASDIYHLKGPGPDGLVGYSVVELARRSIQLGLQEERFGEQYFGRGPMPGGVLELPGGQGGGPGEDEKRAKIRRGFESAYGGVKNAGRVVVLTGGAKFTPLTIANQDAQFLESRRFQVSEICRWYGVPPHKLADLERATFSNVEEQELAFVRDCLLPWARRLESEADIKLFSYVRRGKRFTRLNLDALLRGNSLTQTNTVVSKVNNGLMTVNEGRGYFDLNPIESGDTPLVQGAMIPLERALKEPEPAPVTPPASDIADSQSAQ